MQTSCIEFTLVKEESGSWSRLCKEEEKQTWLRLDYNKWQDEDEETEDEDEETDYEEETEEEELEDGMAGLAVSTACDWAEGLEQEEQYEWLVDCYR